MTVSDPEKMQLSAMVGPETGQIWTEIYGGTYAGALIRLHLQPKQELIMLKRVADTIIHTLPIIKRGLDAIQ